MPRHQASEDAMSRGPREAENAEMGMHAGRSMHPDHVGHLISRGVDMILRGLHTDLLRGVWLNADLLREEGIHACRPCPSPAATRRSFSSCISRAGGGVGLPMLTMPHIPDRSCHWNHTCYLHFPSSWLPGPSTAKEKGVFVICVAVQHILLPHG